MELNLLPYFSGNDHRAKEIGIRKTVGSGKAQIIKQFLVESLIVNLIAFAVAWLFILIFRASVAEFIEINTSLSSLQRPEFWIAVLLLLLVGSFGAGLYPAFVISSVEPVKVLKGKDYSNQSRSSFWSLRHALVVFQFTISIALIAASIVVFKQLSFMKRSSLGINIDNILVLKTQLTFGPPGADSVFIRRLSLFKDKLNTSSRIEGITASYDIPGKEHHTHLPNFRHIKNSDQRVALYFTLIDYNFIPTFEADLLAGRNFSKDINERQSVILNIEALHALGFKGPQEAIGHEVMWGNKNMGRAKVIGVVNFRATSYKTKNYPIAYVTYNFPVKYLSIKFNSISGENGQQNFTLVKNNWEEVFPELPFEYFFLDDLFKSHYRPERQFGQLLTVFTLLTVFVACLGLYGITSLTVLQKTKEVGVRKILGASMKNLLWLLSKNFIILVLIAAIISLPLIHLAMNEWLQNYPYRAEISLWALLLPIVTILVITVITIGQQIIAASLSNPIKALRYE